MHAPSTLLTPGPVRLGILGISILLVHAGPPGAAGYGVPTPHAVEVIAWEGPFGPAPYDDPLAALGPPATEFLDPFRPGTLRQVSLVEPPFHLGPDGTTKLITTIQEGGSLIVRFEQPVLDDPANAYGIDFLVFGNAFYGARGMVGDGADLGRVNLSGEAFFEPTHVSVSPGYSGRPGEDPDDWRSWAWYRYENGPYADTAFPTQAFRWDRQAVAWSGTLMDFAKPVNPALAPLFLAGAGTLPTVADAIDLYDGAGGGTGFDLAESGFAHIQYVRIEALPGYGGGEIDAFAATRPMALGDSLTVAPGNLGQGPATLRFKHPSDTMPVALTLRFTELDGVLRVATQPLEDAAPPTPPPGDVDVVAGALIELQPLAAAELPRHQAELHMAPASRYAGSGDDLQLLRWDQDHWQPEPFHYHPDTRMVAMSGAFTAGRYVLVRRSLLPPGSLFMGRDEEGAYLRFEAVAGQAYTLERTTAWSAWTEVAQMAPGDGTPVTWRDPDPPGGAAFYRVRQDGP